MLASQCFVFGNEFCYTFKNKEVQLRDATIVLQRGDELVRINLGSIILEPAHQGLCTQEGIIHQGKFGLEEDLEVFFREGGIGIVSWIYEEATEYWGKRNQVDKGIVARLEEQIKKDRAQKAKVIFQQKKKKEQKVDFSILEEEDDE